VGGVFLFRSTGGDTPPATVATAPTPAPQPTTTPPTGVTPSPAPAPTAATTAAPAGDSFVLPNATGSASGPTQVAPPAPMPEPVRTIQPTPVAQTPAPVLELPKSEPVRPAAPAKLEPRAINYIEGIRVAGIRASTTDSKVLMNDRVYRLNDTVEHEMGLRLVAITSHSLTFEDDRGARYTRSF